MRLRRNCLPGVYHSAVPQKYFLDLAKASVSPAERSWEEGILLNEGKARPFVLERSWSGPAGNYIEAWALVRGSKVLYQSAPRYIMVWGIQSLSEFRDVVSEAIDLEPGPLKIVFTIEGRFMGEFESEARNSTEAAA